MASAIACPQPTIAAQYRNKQMKDLTCVEPTDPLPNNPPPEALPPDKLQNIVDAVADLPTEDAALNRMRELLIVGFENDFEIGRALSKIKDEEWFDGHKSFEDLCQAEFCFGKSKAAQLVAAMYRTLRLARS